MGKLYRMMYRPATFSTLPPGVTWEYTEAPPTLAHMRPDLPCSRHPFGVIKFNRDLTADECASFEIQELSTAGACSKCKGAGQVLATAYDPNRGISSTGMRPCPKCSAGRSPQ